jgi:serum/glucocorticoid-regulated kinase 2
MSDECKDFISKLLEKDPTNRMGTKEGIQEILSHPWLQDINVEQLVGKLIEPPFKPKLSADVLDVSNFDQ